MAIFAVEVEADGPKPASVVGEMHSPRGVGRVGADRVDAGVAVVVKSPVGVALHHPHVIAGAEATRQFPRDPEIRGHAE